MSRYFASTGKAVTALKTTGRERGSSVDRKYAASRWIVRLVPWAALVALTVTQAPAAEWTEAQKKLISCQLKSAADTAVATGSTNYDIIVAGIPSTCRTIVQSVQDGEGIGNAVSAATFGYEVIRAGIALGVVSKAAP